MRRAWRMAAGLALLAGASSATAQSFNQSINRYRAAKQDCAAAFQRQIQRGCRGACLTAVTTQRDQCLATAERRYQIALRRALAPRR